LPIANILIDLNAPCWNAEKKLSVQGVPVFFEDIDECSTEFDDDEYSKEFVMVP